jgi:hypothetical protein
MIIDFTPVVRMLRRVGEALKEKGTEAVTHPLPGARQGISYV